MWREGEREGGLRELTAVLITAVRREVEVCRDAASWRHHTSLPRARLCGQKDVFVFKPAVAGWLVRPDEHQASSVSSDDMTKTFSRTMQSPPTVSGRRGSE
ncbi:hypothetical protein O3P69_001816 [Scylla paramamosain]|uniref:Uncharacterized protein n=1 Tax=Scylla paramamosain TaxID=85552 RepID=A0AAW0V2H7_SCYPA